MFQTGRRDRPLATGALAALALLSFALILVTSHCSSYSACQPGDCPPGHSCAIGGGCKLQEGSCASDEDCGPNGHCITYSGTGILGSYVDTRCELGPGQIGEPCGGLLEPCVSGASCLFRTSVEVSPEPAVGDTGNSYWFEPRVAFNFITHLGERVCIASGSLGVGEFCSDGSNCAPDLVCHGGYTPYQCRPRSELGGPVPLSGRLPVAFVCAPRARGSLRVR